jgi:hypothetical protein
MLAFIYHFICECIGDGRMDIEHASDILTKPLVRERLYELRDKRG